MLDDVCHDRQKFAELLQVFVFSALNTDSMEQLDHASELAFCVVAGTEHHVSHVFDAQGVVHFDLVVVILFNIWHVLNAMIDGLSCDSQSWGESELQVGRVRDVFQKVWKLVISLGQTTTRGYFTLFDFLVIYLLVLDNELVQSPIYWMDKQQGASFVPEKVGKFLLKQATQVKVAFAHHKVSKFGHDLVRSLSLDLVICRIEDLGEWLNEKSSHYSEGFPVAIRVKRDLRAFAIL